MATVTTKPAVVTVTTAAPVQQNMNPNAPDSVLASLQGVYVEQVKRAAELCGCEMANEYRIYQLDPYSRTKFGPELIHAKEHPGGGFFYRQCCGPCRAVTADVYLASNPQMVLATYQKTQGISWMFCCKAKTSLFTNGAQQEHYDFDNPCGCPGCTSLGFKVANHSYDRDCSLCGHTPCFTYTFRITDAKTGATEGELTKLRQDCGDMVYKTNSFNVIFPPGASMEDKVTMLGAALHSDFNFFEQKKN